MNFASQFHIKHAFRRLKIALQNVYNVTNLHKVNINAIMMSQLITCYFMQEKDPALQSCDQEEAEDDVRRLDQQVSPQVHCVL